MTLIFAIFALILSVVTFIVTISRKTPSYYPSERYKKGSTLSELNRYGLVRVFQIYNSPIQRIPLYSWVVTDPSGSFRIRDLMGEWQITMIKTPEEALHQLKELEKEVLKKHSQRNKIPILIRIFKRKETRLDFLRCLR